MSSLVQVEANRRNSLKSTGPRTPAGKARACLNSITHGLLSGRAIIEGEDAELFGEHCRAMKESLAPQGPMEELLADRIAAQAWRLRRAMALEGRILEETLGRFGVLADECTTGVPSVDGTAGVSDVEAVPPQVVGRAVREFLRSGTGGLDVLRRYERSIEQGFYQALRELKALQESRRAEASAPLPKGKELVAAIERDPEASRILRQFVHDTREQARREALVALAGEAARSGPAGSAAQAGRAAHAGVPAQAGGAATAGRAAAPKDSPAAKVPVSDAPAASETKPNRGPGTGPAFAVRKAAPVAGLAAAGAPSETKPISGGESIRNRGTEGLDEGPRRANEEREEALLPAAAGK
jgi:hypothetical protein